MSDLVWHECSKYPTGHAAVLTLAHEMAADWTVSSHLVCPASWERVEVRP